MRGRGLVHARRPPELSYCMHSIQSERFSCNEPLAHFTYRFNPSHQAKIKDPSKGSFILVRGRGLEPPWVAPLAPKASASTISPPAHLLDCKLYVPDENPLPFRRHVLRPRHHFFETQLQEWTPLQTATGSSHRACLTFYFARAKMSTLCSIKTNCCLVVSFFR